jgi:organic hydroperoxide reductase OsmC/OhrA
MHLCEVRIVAQDARNEAIHRQTGGFAVQELPHHYVVAASADAESNVRIESKGLDSLESAGPAEFGGPGDLWSPETLLVAAVADCFILTFRAIARASRMEWLSLHCDVVGDLDKIERKSQFVGFQLRVRLEVPEGVREDKARRLLEMAEKGCLITNSMKAPSHLETEVTFRSIAA